MTEVKNRNREVTARAAGKLTGFGVRIASVYIDRLDQVIAHSRVVVTDCLPFHGQTCDGIG